MPDDRLGRAGGAAEAGPDGLLDIQDDIGIAESERELPEITSESQVQLSGSAVVSATSPLSF